PPRPKVRATIARNENSAEPEPILLVRCLDASGWGYWTASLGSRVDRRALIAAFFAAVGGVFAFTSGGRAELQLHIDESSIAMLRDLRLEPKFTDLPGAPAAGERRRLEPLINDLLDRLIAGIQAHPTDTWVLAQMEPTVGAFYLEDTEARERCIAYIEAVFKILGIPDDRGAFRKYLVFW
ncbi:DUF4844 domain-containing protein, partial [Paucibacter sp. APW11]